MPSAPATTSSIGGEGILSTICKSKYAGSNFQIFLSENHNIKIINNTINYNDIKDITSINCEFSNINDLSGIEYFTALEHLDCSFNQIDYLDISKNIKLSELHIVRNEIEEIDLSNNTFLRLFSANHNSLYNLDISKNINLKTLFCSNNFLESIVFGEVLPEKIHLIGNPGNWWQKFQNIK